MSGKAGRPQPSAGFAYLINHIFLPPKLPQGSDVNVAHESLMLSTVTKGLSMFKTAIGDDCAYVDEAIAMIARLRDVRDTQATAGFINETKFVKALGDLCKTGGTIPLHLQAQNCGALISKVGNCINFEAFELSPLNESVLTTKGRLRRSFPGPAISVDPNIFEKPSFLSTVAHTLAKMSYQTTVGTIPQANKASRMHDEHRDTTHPMVVTELFVGFLGAVGRDASVSRIWKNTREEVMHQNSHMPWRRSPLWLLVRVALQLHFSRADSLSESSIDMYKMFMVYYMSTILNGARQYSVSNDLIYAMNAKIAQRLLKIEASVDERILTKVQTTIKNANRQLCATWSHIIEKNERPCDLSLLKALDFESDTCISLPTLDKCLKSLAERQQSESSRDFQPSCGSIKFPATELPTRLKSISTDYTLHRLKAFEAWVVEYLNLWLEPRKTDPDTCKKLAGLIREYHQVAHPIYYDNVETLSTMFLTVLELWIACDQSATTICNMLKEYCSGIDIAFLQSLVLPFRSQLERLHRAENYLRARGSKYASPHIFKSFGKENSFSVRYFNQSSTHGDLLNAIQNEATLARGEKADEFRRKKEEYHKLMVLCDQNECEYDEVVVDLVNDFREMHHRPRCTRCGYQSKADGLTIDLHEWPLPTKELEAQSVVFELRVPSFFGHWRDVTVFLRLDVLRDRYQSMQEPRVKYHLETYKELSSAFRSFGTDQRIGLLSQDKPHEVTHRREKPIATAQENEVCLDSGLGYHYYDNKLVCFVDAIQRTSQVPRSCMYKLPTRSSSLQDFLFRPAAEPNGPLHNDILASQFKCPRHMSLDEFKALGAIPQLLLQWQNILLQLSIPVVDFKSAETSLVVLQSIYQAGPPGNGKSNDRILRVAHSIVDDQYFGNGLLQALHEALARVKENWESSNALSTFVAVASRLLSLASKELIKSRSLAFLADLRSVAFRWVNILREKTQQAMNDSQRKELGSMTVEFALICVDSFNLDEKYLEDALIDPKAASMFVQCSIVIQEGSVLISNASDPLISILHQRWKGNSYRCYPVLAKEVLEQASTVLDDAIQQSWSAYRAGRGWRAYSDSIDHWLISQTVPVGNAPSDELSVHFNLLTFELLVNGVPLARLPSKYESHSLYRPLFGHSVLEVMPTTVPGMQFSGKKDYAGHTLHFGLSKVGGTEDDLLIRAVKEHRQYELLSQRIFRGLFPVAFVDGITHWLDRTDNSVEFRPLEDPWTSSSDNWKLMKAGTASQWCLSKDGVALVGISSGTAQALSAILAPLEDPHRIHTMLHHSSSSLEIDLPRLQLGFVLRLQASTVYSKQYRGMYIDADQSLGTLVGFRNKLILMHESEGNRLIVLPEGKLECHAYANHVSVSVDKGSTKRPHVYQVDNLIGRLVDNGSLQSKLFLAYLHAQTSFCLRDPLLRRTGTESALSILSSAAVRSFDFLTPENIELLTQIAQLTPTRSYYPANERVMQSVGWSSHLGFLAQHGSYYTCVRSIFDQAVQAKVFHPDVQLPKLQHVESDLLERDNVRCSTFRIAGFGAEAHDIDHDVEYRPRDCDQKSERALNAFAISRFVCENRQTLHSDFKTNLANNLWTYLTKTQILGSSDKLPISELKYDAQLLSSSNDFVCRNWIGLRQIFGQQASELMPQLMIWLSTLAFAPNVDMQVIQTMAAFMIPAIAQVQPPPCHTISLRLGREVEKAELRQVAFSALNLFATSPEALFTPSAGESHFDFKKRQRQHFEKNRKIAVNTWTNALAAQWPREIPLTPPDRSSWKFTSYMDVAKAMRETEPLFKRWFENKRFFKYLGEIQDAVGAQAVNPIPMPLYSFNGPTFKHRKRSRFISVDDVFHCSVPFVPLFRSKATPDLLSPASGVEVETPRLPALINGCEARSFSTFEKNYFKDLRSSELSLRDHVHEYALHYDDDELKTVLNNHLLLCKEHVRHTYEAIISALISPTGHNKWARKDEALNRTLPGSNGIVALPEEQSDNGGFTAMVEAQQWPRLSPFFLLQQLARDRWDRISQDWKSCVVYYALALSDLQRAERLAKLSGRKTDLIKELQNSGHSNWSPMFYPESLLLEVESAITIREVQESIAAQMRDPPSGENAVMQLNMGEGKSSVIVPIVAAALANDMRLVRVIVAKPQSKQMLEMLLSKLGGLLGRRIYHMPFSRALRLGEAEAVALGDMYRECMTTGGILLVQPEHILSFKLMSLECLISGKETVGNSLLRTQHFFDTSSRDIVDESDENFSVKFELIYTMGTQRPIEFSPDRWTCIQRVLDLVKLFSVNAKEKFPDSIDVHEAWNGSFPRTRFLRPDAEQFVLKKIAERICQTGLESFPIARQPVEVREPVFKYMTKLNLTAAEISQVENQGPGGFWAAATSGTLLLLRGLLAGGVLAFAFGQKRWKVNYGLDTTRKPSTNLAVPYRAKDSPTPRSEFSHPDVVIVLTSLSYYYGGLTDKDLFLAFGHLMKSDQADIEYQAWVKDAPELEESFRHLTGINLNDRVQCEKKAFPSLRYAKSAIDYFLAHIIFPKEMKEFPDKLSTSGWDIGATKTLPTTGFSGTIDSQKVLPLSMNHIDLREQNHTNALVLEYLLRDENSIALMPPREKGSSSDAELLLGMVTKMGIQVILDVGAQILELSNLEVAKYWLKMTPTNQQAQAVVFFNDSDELSVLDRKGNLESLQTSSFAKQLDICFVFLDEAHTRGTDLKLPEDYRAAVTLGPNLTKDRLVQACMRMRKLGEGQSVVFFVPEEIKNKIMERVSKSDDAEIDVSDAISWALLETFLDIRRSMPLWAVQGDRFEKQYKLWSEARKNDGLVMSKAQAERFLEEEARSLEARYRPSTNTDITFLMRLGQSEKTDLIIERCWEFNYLKFNSATLQEEQERELSPEIEEERQAQKPVSADAAQHQLHADVRKFVADGMPVRGSKAYMAAFQSLCDTSAALHLDVAQFPKELLVTYDFARTIKAVGISSKSDTFQRPVQWVLTSSFGLDENIQHMMIISPFEAQELLDDIRKSNRVALHLYSPRPNLGFRSLDSLDLWTMPARASGRVVPRHFVVLLNLFAGQLYLSSFKEYIELCELLGLAWKTTEDGCIVAADGFIVERDEDREEMSTSKFEKSPVKFLRVLMTKIRRNCEGIEKTHMGKILDGRLLLPADFGEEEEEKDQRCILS